MKFFTLVFGIHVVLIIAVSSVRPPQSTTVAADEAPTIRIPDWNVASETSSALPNQDIGQGDKGLSLARANESIDWTKTESRDFIYVKLLRVSYLEARFTSSFSS